MSGPDFTQDDVNKASSLEELLETSMSFRNCLFDMRASMSIADDADRRTSQSRQSHRPVILPSSPSTSPTNPATPQKALCMDGFTEAASFNWTSSPDINTKGKELRKSARILLADDLDLNRKLIADMLSFEGHDIDCVEDGMAAVKAASVVDYDLILMDMIMPVMDGLEATVAIRALSAPHGNVPIVALTANAFREHLDACLAAGMDAALTKPMSMDALMRAVEVWRRKDLR